MKKPKILNMVHEECSNYKSGKCNGVLGDKYKYTPNGPILFRTIKLLTKYVKNISSNIEYQPSNEKCLIRDKKRCKFFEKCILPLADKKIKNQALYIQIRELYNKLHETNRRKNRR